MQKTLDLDSLQKMGSAIGSRLSAGDIIALNGPIGAGKTTLARAIIRTYLGRDIDVPSPTYVLCIPYDEKDPPLYHADLFRLSKPEELKELGMDDILGRGILIVEWAKLIAAQLPKEQTLQMTFAFVEPADMRQLTLASSAPKWRDWIADND